MEFIQVFQNILLGSESRLSLWFIVTLTLYHKAYETKLALFVLCDV